MLGGLLNVDKAEEARVSLGLPQLAGAGQAKGSWEAASLAVLQHLLLAAGAEWGCVVRRPCPSLGRADSRSEPMLFLATRGRASGVTASLLSQSKAPLPRRGRRVPPGPPLDPGSGLYLPLGESGPSFHQGQKHPPPPTDAQHCAGGLRANAA